MLAVKQLGFSIAEIRKLTVDDALMFIDLSIPDKSEKKPKRASQADIDRFMR